MIVNSLDNKKIKILVDEIDLNKANISLSQWICNQSNTSLYIKNLLKNYNFPKDFITKNYSIYTNNYKVFLITIHN